ncbi:hypothetical protein B0H10DRAFT_1959705 [Mycena sp. CBHHK59/15]|nr:hypothetical protein B0H10DRAFT_1959705 [Mycena sp. CBHHK59/15]
MFAAQFPAASPFAILVPLHVPPNPTYNGSANTTTAFLVFPFRVSDASSADSRDSWTIRVFTGRLFRKKDIQPKRKGWRKVILSIEMNMKKKEVFLALLSVSPESKTLILCGMCDLCLLLFSFDGISLFPVDRKGVIKLPHSATLIVKLKEGLSNDLKVCSFIAYDDACDRLRHIVIQNPNDPWLTTKFIVDAWHYIGHRASDILCRLWCNPAPVNGSQPDLVLVEEDDNGVRHQIRAFNTETAEQLNSWLNGFEPQLRQMSDVNYDFFVHILLMIYGDTVEEQVAKKDLGLSDEFWAEAMGN